MKCLRLALVLGLFGGLASAAPTPVSLEVGAQVVLEGRVTSFDRSSAIEVTALGERQVLVTGRAPGSSLLVTTSAAGKKAWRVSVSAFDPVRAAAALKALMPPVEALTVGFEGMCPWVECEACSEAELEKIHAVVALYPCVRAVHWLTPPREPLVVLAGARAVLGEGSEETPGLVLDVREGRVLLRGTARTAAEAERVARVRAQFPEVIVHVVGP